MYCAQKLWKSFSFRRHVTILIMFPIKKDELQSIQGQPRTDLPIKVFHLEYTSNYFDFHLVLNTIYLTTLPYRNSLLNQKATEYVTLNLSKNSYWKCTKRNTPAASNYSSIRSPKKPPLPAA